MLIHNQRRWYAALLILLLAAFILGCTKQEKGKALRNPLQTPEDTVLAFCGQDAAGMRLASATWKNVQPYIAWSEEPGWDEVTVISGYRILKTIKKTASHALIAVEYAVQGRSSDAFVRLHTLEMVEFTVKKTERGWKIVQPNFLQPHVLPRPLIAHLEGVQDAERAASLRRELVE